MGHMKKLLMVILMLPFVFIGFMWMVIIRGLEVGVFGFKDIEDSLFAKNQEAP